MNLEYESIPCREELSGLHGCCDISGITDERIAQRAISGSKIVDSLEEAVRR